MFKYCNANKNLLIFQEGEDDILDFLSSKDVSQKITTSKPINAFEIQEWLLFYFIIIFEIIEFELHA